MSLYQYVNLPQDAKIAEAAGKDIKRLDFVRIKVTFQKKNMSGFKLVCKCLGGEKFENYEEDEKDRNIKWPIETHVAQLFDIVFVATNYHAKKLGWINAEVITFPKTSDRHFRSLFIKYRMWNNTTSQYTAIPTTLEELNLTTGYLK